MTKMASQFNLGANDLTASIPSELTRLTESSYYFSLHSNSKMNGTIATEFGLFTKLTQILHFYNLDLTGSIPSQLGNMPFTASTGYYFNLALNKLTSTIPTELGRPAFQRSFYLNSNELTGEEVASSPS